MLDQTWKEWELLLVDDGSEDGQLEVMKSFAAIDPRVRVESIEHQGYAGALNHALSMVTGQLVAKQDADDWSDPTRLEKQVSTLLAGNFDIVSCGMLRAWPDGTQTVIESSGMIPEQFETKQPGAATCIARKEVFDRVGGFNRAYFLSGDSDWIFRALELDNPPLRWGHVDEPLYVYRTHEGQMSVLGHDLAFKIHFQLLDLYRPRIWARLKGTK